jgi:hypothetical protein
MLTLTLPRTLTLSQAWTASNQQPAPILPNKELIGFARVTLAPGASTVVHFNVTAAKLTTVDEFGTVIRLCDRLPLEDAIGIHDVAGVEAFMRVIE